MAKILTVSHQSHQFIEILQKKKSGKDSYFASL